MRSSVDTLSPGGASVQVFFTERAGGKSQVHYFNTEAAAKAFRGPAAHFREIVYHVTGEKGSPQGLEVRFNDKDNKPVELSMEFSPGQPLSDVHAGLTNQMGHNRDILFLIFFREKAASAVHNRIVIGGQDFSITAERATSAEQLSRTGYRSNAFVVTFHSEDLSVRLGRQRAHKLVATDISELSKGPLARDTFEARRQMGRDRDSYDFVW